MAKILLAKSQESGEIWVWELKEVGQRVIDNIEFLEGRILDVEEGDDVFLRHLWDFSSCNLVKRIFYVLYHLGHEVTKEDLEKLIKDKEV